MVRFVTWALLAGAAAAATPPGRVNYQGVLRDAADDPQTGVYDMVFRFFDGSGNEILIDQHLAAGTGAVTVSGGLFEVALGGGNLADGSGPGTYGSLGAVFRDFDEVWLEIQVAGETLAPRVRIEASPYALNAGHVDGLSSSQFLRSDATALFSGGALTLSAGTLLQIQGDLAVEGGTPGEGRVLTSDSSGNATWQDLPAVQSQVLRDLSDRLDSEDASSLPFAALLPFECGGDPSRLGGTLNGAPLGPGTVIVGFVGEERISRPFRYVVELKSSTADLVQIGQTFQMTLDPGGIGAAITFSAGEVTEAGTIGYADGVYSHVIAVEPRLARRDEERRFEVFRDVTWSDIVQSLMADAGIADDIAATSHQYEQVIQYEESDLDFLHRVSALEGLHYHFGDGGTPRFRLGSDFSTSAQTIPYYGGQSGPAGTQYLATFHPRDRDFASVVTVAGWDSEAKARVSSTQEETAPPLGARESRQFFGDASNAELTVVRVRAARARELSQRFEIVGTGTAAGLRAGYIFSVSDQTGTGEAGGQYYVTSIVHYATQDEAGQCVSYGNALTALPKSATAVSPYPDGIPYAPPLEPLSPAVRGPIPGRVTNADDPDGLGRVEVELLPAPAADGIAVWARVATPVGRWRDKPYRPEVDDEVLVVFLRDEPDAPVVIGGLYNGIDAPRDERRLYFPTGTAPALHPEDVYIEWDDLAGRFEMDRTQVAAAPGLFVKGSTETGGNLLVAGTVNAGGAITGGSLTASGAINGASLKVNGLVEGLQLDISGTMTGDSLLMVEGPIFLNGGSLSYSGGVFQFLGGLSTSGAATLTGTLTADDVLLGSGARFTDTAGSAFVGTSAADADDLTLQAGNSIDDGSILILGKSTTTFRSGNGYFNFYNGATGARNAELGSTGNLRIRGTLSESVALDIAESFRAAEPLEPGDLVRLAPGSPAMVRRTAEAGDPLVLGVVSTRPGMLLGGAPLDVELLRETWGAEVADLYASERDSLRERVLRDHTGLRTSAEQVGLLVPDGPAHGDWTGEPPAARWDTETGGETGVERPRTDDRARIADREIVREEIESLCLERFYEERFVPVALAGRVPVKADASFGEIRSGDRLTPSPVPGVAMKAAGPGPTIGMALEGLAAGRGTVTALVQRNEFFAQAGPDGGEARPDNRDAAETGTESVGTGTDSAVARPDGTQPPVPGHPAPFAVRGELSASGRDEVLRVDEKGNLFLRGAVQPGSMDLAELFPLSEPASAGDLLVVDRDQPGRYRLARDAQDPAVVGIVSAAPGVLLGAGIDRIAAADRELAAALARARESGDAEEEAVIWSALRERFLDTHAPVALSGTVPCKVDAGFGAIEPGDLLTTSPTPGHAMRAAEAAPGTIVGKALEPLESGIGVIRVLVMLR